jgi:hypothetical protein
MTDPSPGNPGSSSSASSSATPATRQETFMVTIGDIGVSRHRIVTPNGAADLADSQWIVRDMTRTETKIPGWAIVLAIIFALACLLGLLFLLVKERTMSGYVEVQVQSGPLLHVTQIPASDPSQVAYVRQLVSYAQSLAAAARH